jgi:hypothetical protein
MARATHLEKKVPANRAHLNRFEPGQPTLVSIASFPATGAPSSARERTSPLLGNLGVAGHGSTIGSVRL